MTPSPVSFVHIAAGGLCLFAGAAALLARKGARLHRIAGTAAVAALLIMAGSAIYLGVTGTFGLAGALSGALVFYFGLTAWLAVGRPRDKPGSFAAMILGFGVAAIYAGLFVRSLESRLAIAPVYLFGAGLAGLGAAFDVAVLARGVSGPQRILRHVWRICLPFFMANSFFFLAQPAVFSDTPFLLRAIPPLAVLAVMIGWLIRIRFRLAENLRLPHP